MNNLKSFDEHINEEFGFGFWLSAILVLLIINFRYSRFGLSGGRNWSNSWQKYPIRGFIRYIKMSKIIKKYKNKIKEIDENILDRNPEIKNSLNRLKEKNFDPCFTDMTSPAFYGDMFVNSVLNSCTPEERVFVQQLSDDFNAEMEDLFYE